MIDARQRVAAPGRQNELLEVRRHDHLSGARTPRRCCYSSRLAASTRPRPARGHCWRIAPAEHHLVDKIAHIFAVSPVRVCVCVRFLEKTRYTHTHTPVRRRTPTSPAQKIATSLAAGCARQVAPCLAHLTRAHALARPKPHLGALPARSDPAGAGAELRLDQISLAAARAPRSATWGAAAPRFGRCSLGSRCA